MTEAKAGMPRKRRAVPKAEVASVYSTWVPDPDAKGPLECVSIQWILNVLQRLDQTPSVPELSEKEKALVASFQTPVTREVLDKPI
ncbi:MAG: hypothetical protein HY719_11985 [Planctomycetes bacterium]|nr:hypothetical protein [Planctomycetota bacterium]